MAPTLDQLVCWVRLEPEHQHQDTSSDGLTSHRRTLAFADSGRTASPSRTFASRVSGVRAGSWHAM
eukprot:928399-Rhodomonas_salina.2